MRGQVALACALLLCAAPWAAAAERSVRPPPAAASREAAVRHLSSADAGVRLRAIQRLAAIGRMADADRLVRLLFDEEAGNRAAAEAALWRIWGRSGDARVDALYRHGVEQMGRGDADGALATFSEIIRRKPAFAEGWNKRATVLYFLGRLQESLADCDQVMTRNPNHFGALSGYGQIHLRLENYEKALEYFERAIAINPNMEGVAVNIAALRQLLAERARRTI